MLIWLLDFFLGSTSSGNPVALFYDCQGLDFLCCTFARDISAVKLYWPWTDHVYMDFFPGQEGLALWERYFPVLLNCCYFILLADRALLDCMFYCGVPLRTV